MYTHTPIYIIEIYIFITYFQKIFTAERVSKQLIHISLMAHSFSKTPAHTLAHKSRYIHHVLVCVSFAHRAANSWRCEIRK